MRMTAPEFSPNIKRRIFYLYTLYKRCFGGVAETPCIYSVFFVCISQILSKYMNKRPKLYTIFLRIRYLNRRPRAQCRLQPTTSWCTVTAASAHNSDLRDNPKGSGWHDGTTTKSQRRSICIVPAPSLHRGLLRLLAASPAAFLGLHRHLSSA
jgi:hypothetical protein